MEQVTFWMVSSSTKEPPRSPAHLETVLASSHSAANMGEEGSKQQAGGMVNRGWSLACFCLFSDYCFSEVHGSLLFILQLLQVRPTAYIVRIPKA